MANNAKKSDAPKKKGFFSRIGNYFAESYKELKKVSWPTRKELFKSTWVVVVIVALTAVLVYAFDALFSFITNLFYNLV